MGPLYEHISLNSLDDSMVPTRGKPIENLSHACNCMLSKNNCRDRYGNISESQVILRYMTQ